MADALFSAQDAIEMWLWDAENKGEAIPPASGMEDAAKLLESADQALSMVAADTDEYRRRNDTRFVRKTLAIPAWLNHQAEKANAPFSQILQQGLKEHLRIPQ
ncbi:MAG: type II toxin-antitoxin system HicB family antitoxin [Treponema sp.]|nr:type II toxin-antitoxin system HicB family antitoxin [Treponema sp.]